MARMHPVVAYMRGVQDGSIVACRWIQLAVQRHMDDLEHGADRGLRFDRAAAEYVLQFFGFLKHSKGEWAGKPFRLEPWEQFIIWTLFGWKRADGTRRYRVGYIEIARKNGKTTLVAGIGLYLLTADKEPGAEVYSAATKRDQAKLSWTEAVRMVRASKELSRMVKHWRASDNLSVAATNSKFEPLGADANSMDGLNISGALIDELHAHKTSAIVDVLETATGARRQPLIVEITTAGYDRQSICWEHHEYTRQVLEGTIEDDTWFGAIFALDEGDDWQDESVWAKANPNLRISVNVDDLRRKRDKAQRMPIAQNAFKRLHLNQWTQQSDLWISVELWDENGDGEIDEDELEGRVCYGGLDLSAVADLTAWVMVFPRDEEPDELDIIARFWCPEERLVNPENRYREQYQVWAEAGALQVTPGNAIDYQAIRQQILSDAQWFDLVDMNVDRLFQGYQLSMELQDEGLDVFGMGQGFLSMAVPMHALEERLLKRYLHHGNNPVLRWMAGNMTVRQDPAGNLKPDKKESQGRIDGMVSLVMALDRAMRHAAEGGSVYEERGMIVL